MSAELKDFRGKVTPETDAVLEAHNRMSGRDKSEIAREVLHRWALEQIHTTNLIGKLINGTGTPGSPGDSPGKTRES